MEPQINLYMSVCCNRASGFYRALAHFHPRSRGCCIEICTSGSIATSIALQVGT